MFERYGADAATVNLLSRRRLPRALPALQEERRVLILCRTSSPGARDLRRAYCEKLLQLIRPGGLIAVDDTLWNAHVANPRDNDSATVELRAFNDYVDRDERVDLALVPIGDGLTLLRKRLMD